VEEFQTADLVVDRKKMLKCCALTEDRFDNTGA
jgi:hypothetical protein